MIPPYAPGSRYFTRTAVTRAADAYEAADELIMALDDVGVRLGIDDRYALTLWFIERATREVSVR